MGRNTWDAVLASTPLNVTAGAVTSKGYQYEPNVEALGRCWDDLPEMLAVSDPIFQQPQFTDLTGQKFGRLTVLGIAAEDDAKGQRKTKGALWICRCVCGRFSGQRGKTLKEGRQDRCSHCNHTQRLAFFASGKNARIRAEAPEARKWTTPQPNVDEGDE